MDGSDFVHVFIAFAVFGLIMTAILQSTQDPNAQFQKGVQKITYEGHEYLIYDRGVCHYPECKCLTKTEAKGENGGND